LNPAARLPFIDALKGLAILGVLFTHMAFTTRFDAAALAHIRLLQTLSGWCVLAFFFASGVLHGHADAERDLKSFARRRAIRLLIPCAAFTWLNKLLLLAAKAGGLLGADAAPSLATPADIAAFVFVPAAPQFYFLAHLFLIAVIVHALLKIRLVAHPLAPWILAALLLQSYMLLPLDRPHGKALTQLPLYAAAYLTGFAFARSRGAETRDGTFQYAGIAIFAGDIAIAAPAHPQLLHALVPLAFAALAPLLPTRIFSVPAALGKKSGAIYAWHAPIVMTALSIVLVKASLTGWLLIAAMMLLTIAASILIASIVRRFDPHGIFRL
jgi:fucose 4-O-acetylase-like acetyltransferase